MKEYIFGLLLQFHWACRIIRIPHGQDITLESKNPEKPNTKQNKKNPNNNKKFYSATKPQRFIEIGILEIKTLNYSAAFQDKSN